MKRWIVLLPLFGAGCAGSPYDAIPSVPQPSAEPPGAPTQEAPDYVALHHRVREALETTPGLDDSDVTITVLGTTVRLAGSVPTPAQRALAWEAARRVEGVEKVLTDELSTTRVQ